MSALADPQLYDLPVLGRPVFGQQRVRHIHLDKWNCSQPHLQYRVARAVLPGQRQCQFRAAVVRGAATLRCDLRHSEQRQHIGHSRSPERQHVLYSVLLQRVGRRCNWGTELCLYPATLPNSYALYQSESNSYIHANAYSNCHVFSDRYCYTDQYSYGYVNTYSDSHVYAYSDAYWKCPTYCNPNGYCDSHCYCDRNSYTAAYSLTKRWSATKASADSRATLKNCSD